MAEAIQVAGVAGIHIDANQGSGLEFLGYSVNGVTISWDWYTMNVPGDQNGGDDGPPIDIQQFGEIARVRCEMSKFDLSVWNKVLARVPTKTVGLAGTVGQLLLGTASSTFRLLINPTLSQVHNFPVAIPRIPIDNNVGSKYSRPVVEFECHMVSGTLKNETT